MKKIVLLLIISLFLLITPVAALNQSSDDDMINVFGGFVRHDNNTIAHSYIILAHNETGVCYLIVQQQNSSLSVIPMVLENGQPYVYMTPKLVEERNINASGK